MEKKENGIGSVLLKMGSAALAIFAKGTKIWLAVASAASYTYLFGWRFAIAIMVLLFIHESGHVWAMRKCGIPTTGFYYIPLLGGAAVPDRDFKSRAEEFFVAIMGPVWGFLLAFVVGIIYFITGNAIFAVIASWMALVNLFNLLPINPLDGGRMLKSLLFSINSKLAMFSLYVGIIAFAVFLFVFKIYLFAILLIVSGLEIHFERKRKEPLPSIPKNKLWIYSVMFLLIIFLLYGVMYVMKGVPGSDIAHKLIYG
jgi:Zn-dependent protease